MPDRVATGDAARHERGKHQGGDAAGQRPLREPEKGTPSTFAKAAADKAARIGVELWLEPGPHVALETGTRLHRRRRLDQAEHALQLCLCGLAISAFGEVLINPRFVGAIDLAVVVENQFVFREVVGHGFHGRIKVRPYVVPLAH